MRFGLCCDVDLARDALKAGFDYVEIAANGFAQDEDFNVRTYRSLSVEASNVFFPGGLKLFDDPAPDISFYVAQAVRRAADIGIATMVIGSGAARTAPDGMDLVEAEAQFVAICAEISRVAGNYGIQVAPESLGRAETNVGRDLGALAYALADHGVGYTADSYHILYEWQQDGGEGIPPESLWADQIPFTPTHVHLGTIPREAPWEDASLLEGFVSRLYALGYDGRVSIESKLASRDVETLKAVHEQLVALFA